MQPKEILEHLLSEETETLNEVTWIILERWRQLSGHRYLFSEDEVCAFRQVLAETIAGMMDHYGAHTKPLDRSSDGVAGRINFTAPEPAERTT
jgi:hypothetical protein